MRLFITVMVAILWTTQALAQDIQVVGKLQSHISPAKKSLIKAYVATPPKSVTVMKIQLSDNAWVKLQNKTALEVSSNTNTTHEKRLNNVQLGMNNLPVFDQGPHSTCVTFANSAAISAALNKDDYISELCHLQLGRYLEKNGYTLSGWNGSLGPIVLNQMQVFGIVTKETQRTLGCSGYNEYPTHTFDEPESDLSLTDYHTLSTPFPEEIGWSSILDTYHVFVDKVNPEDTLKQVIRALNAGDRLTFGVLLFRIDQGTGGAVGKHNETNDTWILTPEITQAIQSKTTEVGGHEMIITGYDDNATAVDSQGQVHIGLLTLRNSWGDKLGDKGNFYMSYDYFKALTIEVQRIRSLN